MSRPSIRAAALFALLTCIGLGVISTQLLLSAVLDCIAALVVLIPAVMLGYGIVFLLPLGTISTRWRFLLAAGVGLGATSLLVLGFGLLGLLSRPLWLVILGLFVLLGVLAFRHTSIERNVQPSTLQRSPSTKWVYAWLLFVPFLVIAVRNASNAPGFIWGEEGYGYDVLEYHLQVPKEYLQQGRISYLPHNVYASFPSNVEMLYLLSMIVHGGTSDVGTVANAIHLLLGMLFVLALWNIGREWSPGAGMAAAFAGGTVGWLPYLSGLAYVEHGMLLIGALALAALIRAFSQVNPPPNQRLWTALSGLFAGLACGCKYPAVAMIALPLFIVVFIVSQGAWIVRLRQAFIFLVTCVAAFAPWLLKNAACTGNPIFPLANSVFHSAPPGWGAEEDARWVRGHSPSLQEEGAIGQARTLWARTLGDPFQRFGPVVLLLPILLCIVRTMDRWHIALLVLLLVQLLVWICATHLFARFSVPLLLPTCALLALEFHQLRSWTGRAVVVAAVTLGAAWNFSFAAKLSQSEALSAAAGSFFSDGQVPGFDYLGVVNRELPSSAKLLLVGDAKPYYIERQVDYCVVFNRNPFVEAVRASKEPVEVLHWLQERGYTHVLVNWGEVARLRATYGFAAEVSPALFETLQQSGLPLVRSFSHPTSDTRYIDLFSVPPSYNR